MKNIFASIVGIIAMALCSFSTLAQTTTAIDSVKVATIKVANLHCNNDMPTIKKQLLNQEGIDEVTFTEISGVTSIFTITYHTSVTHQDKIEEVIESTPGCDDQGETPYRVKKMRSHKRRMP